MYWLLKTFKNGHYIVRVCALCVKQYVLFGEAQTEDTTRDLSPPLNR